MGTVRTAFLDGRGLNLAAALGVARGEVVALVGGGGKTSAMFRLATELASQGGRVLVTTTTHIYPPDPTEFPTVSAIGAPDTLENLLARVRAAIARHPIVVVARGLSGDGRLVAIDPAWVAALRDQLPITNLLIEADGSKGRPFKAPAPHEPVIPGATDLVVPVVGLSAVGQPLSEKFVHRPERVATLAGIQPGDTLSPSAIAAVLLHPEGSARGAPASARIAPLLNQADDTARLDAGRQIARELIEGGMKRAVIAALRAGRAGEDQPVRAVAMAASGDHGSAPAISAIIMAAGQSRRMGAPKLALRLGGKSLLRWVVEAALATHLNEIIVVLGHGAADLECELPADRRVRAVYNRDYAQGQSSSLKMGIEAVSHSAEAVIFLLGDQPFIQPEAIEALVSAFRIRKAPVLQLLYRGAPGHPVLFARPLFPELLQVAGDQGGREVLSRHRAEVFKVDLDWDPPRDVDTREDYQSLVGKQPQIETDLDRF